MKPDSFFAEYAKSAYRAYGQATGFKNFQGTAMPKWKDLPEYIQRAWISAVKDVFQRLNVRDSETDEPYVR